MSNKQRLRNVYVDFTRAVLWTVAGYFGGAGDFAFRLYYRAWVESTTANCFKVRALRKVYTTLYRAENAAKVARARINYHG